MSTVMVSDMIECFVWGFIYPLPFFFVLWLVRQVKKYFTDASGIKVE